MKEEILYPEIVTKRLLRNHRQQDIINSYYLEIFNKLVNNINPNSLKIFIKTIEKELLKEMFDTIIDICTEITIKKFGNHPNFEAIKKSKIIINKIYMDKFFK